MSDPNPKVKLATKLPSPSKVTPEQQQEMIAEARKWSAEVSLRARAIEAVTASDLKVRAS